MRKFFVLVSISFCWQISYAFDQMPHELLTKIILKSDGVIALSQTSIAMRECCMAWASSKDKNFLPELFDDNTAGTLYFVLKNNKKITNSEVVYFVEKATGLICIS